jgi:hypothetical protein
MVRLTQAVERRAFQSKVGGVAGAQYNAAPISVYCFHKIDRRPHQSD